MRVETKPTIVLAAMGGTIASQADQSGLRAAELGSSDFAGWVADLAEVLPVDVKRVRSSAVTPADMCLLAHELSDCAQRCDGIVITHGTDAIEETAYALAVQLKLGVPVVLTGAMRPADQPGADGPANLRAAFQVASEPAAAELGPLIVLADQIHLARWATKISTARVDAFSSPGFGPIGQVVEGNVYLAARPKSRDYLGLPASVSARVELIWIAAGSDGLLVEAAATSADGLVVAGSGGGHVPPPVAESLEKVVAAGTEVILTSRCGSGAVLTGTYRGIGSETHLREIGVRSATDLSPLKARLRLIFAMSLGLPIDEVFPPVK